MRSICTGPRQPAAQRAPLASPYPALELPGNALDLHWSSSSGRSKRVTAFSLAIARATGLGPDLIRVIARGAFFLDLGKIAVPYGILRKPGALVEDEVVIVRQYC